MKPKNLSILVIFLSICPAKAQVLSGDGLKLGTSNTVPTGSNSIAGGAGNSVSVNSIAAGSGNSASNNSLVVGDSSAAYSGSLAGGWYSSVDSLSNSSLVFGEENHAYSSSATTLLGAYNAMYGQFSSVALGCQNTIQTAAGKVGFANVLIGQSNSAYQANDLEEVILIGSYNYTQSSRAFAFGVGNIAQTDTVTLGTYAQTVPNASLIVGKGNNSGARSNGLVVLKNGEVQIAGSLVVGGSPILTQVSAPSYMTGQGFVNTSYLTNNGYLKKSNGLSSNASATAALAVGELSVAMGDNAFAVGQYSQALGSGAIALGNESFSQGTSSVALGLAYASGNHSFAAAYGSANSAHSVAIAGFAYGDSGVAIGGFDSVSEWSNESHGKGATSLGGYLNAAIGDYSYAMGNESVSFGSHSFSLGHSTRSSAYQVSMGNLNLSSQNLLPNASNSAWLEDGALFELGNGNPLATPRVASNAITTLKNGQTTLTNKAWKNRNIATTPATADPSTLPTDSGGSALVVDGHTFLNGKVVINVPQGDISMGIYE